MPRSNVRKPNCTATLYDSQRVPYATELIGALQKDSRPELPAILQARGNPVGDLTLCYSLRIDLQGKQLPQSGDKIFISALANAPVMTGWYSIWGEPDPSTGRFGSLLLYINRENL